MQETFRDLVKRCLEPLSAKANAQFTDVDLSAADEDIEDKLRKVKSKILRKLRYTRYKLFSPPTYYNEALTCYDKIFTEYNQRNNRLQIIDPNVLLSILQYLSTEDVLAVAATNRLLFLFVANRIKQLPALAVNFFAKPERIECPVDDKPKQHTVPLSEGRFINYLQDEKFLYLRDETGGSETIRFNSDEINRGTTSVAPLSSGNGIIKLVNVLVS